MAHSVDLPIVVPRLLADGDHEDPMAARSGTESLVAAASVGDDGLTYIRVWDLATGRAVGPPVLGNLDGADGTFGTVPTADGDRPTLVVERGAAITQNGTIVLATAHGLFAVDPAALPAG